MEQKRKVYRVGTWLHWIARVLSALAAAYWLLMGIGGAISEPGPLTVESALVGVMIALATVGVIIAWLKEGLGGIIILTFAVVFSTFAFFSAGRWRGSAMAVSGGPFFIIGALFLVSWRLRHTMQPHNTL